MARTFRYLTLFALPWVTIATGAQQEMAEERQLNFTVFSADPIAGLAYRPRAKAGLSPLVFYPTARSPRYDYRGPAAMCLLDSATGNVVAEIIVPAGISSALLVLMADKAANGGPRYRVRVLDDSAHRQAPGELQVLNFSGLLLSGTINRKRVTLTEGGALKVLIGLSADIQLRTLFHDASYQAYADSVQLEKSARALLILLPPYRRGALEVQSRLLLDIPPRDAGKDTQGR